MSDLLVHVALSCPPRPSRPRSQQSSPALILSKSRRPVVACGPSSPVRPPSTIGSRAPSSGETIVATAFGLAIMLSVRLPAVIDSLVPERSAQWLERMSEWILANSRMPEVVVGIGFGPYFLAKGLIVLL